MAKKHGNQFSHPITDKISSHSSKQSIGHNRVHNIAASQKLCNLMKAQVLKRHSGLRDRGGKPYNFAMCNTATINAYCEGLFITGQRDQEFFNPESQLMKFAEAYFAGIQEYFGLSATVPTTPVNPATPTANNGKLYRVQVGAYSVKANADSMLAKVKAAGFKDAFIRFD